MLFTIEKEFYCKCAHRYYTGEFISFEFEEDCGSKTYSKIIVESGLVDYLQKDDNVLADTWFPEIKKRYKYRCKRNLNGFATCVRDSNFAYGPQYFGINEFLSVVFPYFD